MDEMQTIISFIQNTSYKDLSEKTRQNIRYAFKDTIAVSLASIESTETKIVQNVIKKSTDIKKDVSLIELALQLNPVDMAFLIGTMSHVLDFDDVNFTFQGHPSVTLIPIILTLGKKYNLSGKEMITS